MNEQNQAVVKADQQNRSPVPIGSRGVVIADLEGLWRFASYVQKSGLAPKGIQTTEAIFVAIQMGLEVGLTPMAALQNIAVINGRPSIWGDAQLAVCRGTRELVEFEEWFEVGGKRQTRNPSTYTDDTTAICKVKREGFSAAEVAFSVADAKQANLWGKDGPWKQYPWRMLRMRARSFALRDQFGDALRGMKSAEEAQDMTIEVEPVTTTVRLAPPALLSDASEPIPGAESPQRNSTQETATEAGNVAASPQGEGSAAPAGATTQAAPVPPATNPRVATIRKQLSRAGLTEGDAVTQIHKMFPNTEGCNSLDDVQEIAPNVVNSLMRGWESFVNATRKSKGIEAPQS